MLKPRSAWLFALVATFAFAQKPPIQITADLTEAPRKLYHAEIDIPVTAGPLALIIPKWIPGHHSRQSKTASAPMHFILQNDTIVTESDVDNHDGERYPTLERVEGTPAYLDDIAKPLAQTAGVK